MNRTVCVYLRKLSNMSKNTLETKLNIDARMQASPDINKKEKSCAKSPLVFSIQLDIENTLFIQFSGDSTQKLSTNVSWQ